MRKFFPAVLLVIAFLVMFRNCHSPAPSDPAPAPGVARDEVAEPVADEGARATWPPLRDGGPAASPGNGINYYIVLDGSGSMQSQECGGGVSKMQAAVQAVSNFVSAAPATANIGLAAFDQRSVSERVPLGVGNRDALADALLHIQAGSGTPLKTGISIGYNKLTEQARLQLGYGEYHLIVVTDGRPEPYTEDPTPVVQEILARSPVVLHTVGFCIDANHVLNQPGRTYYASASSPQELQQSLQAVLAEAPAFDVAKFK